MLQLKNITKVYKNNNYIQKVADMTFTITKVDEHRIIEADLVIVRSDIPEENQR